MRSSLLVDVHDPRYRLQHLAENRADINGLLYAHTQESAGARSSYAPWAVMAACLVAAMGVLVITTPTSSSDPSDTCHQLVTALRANDQQGITKAMGYITVDGQRSYKTRAAAERYLSYRENSPLRKLELQDIRIECG